MLAMTVMLLPLAAAVVLSVCATMQVDMRPARVRADRRF
jgi:hypothetical protein